MKHKDLTKLLVDAQITSDMSAMMATTDGSVPTVIMRLIGQRGDQWEITAITPGTQRRYVPASPLTTDRLYRWSADRLFGKQVTPPAVEVVEEGYYVRVMGNAVVAESWLRDRGWHSAYAGSPNAVWLGTLCKGKMRPVYRGDYYQCDQCEYMREA